MALDPFSSSGAVSKNQEKSARGGRGGETTMLGVHQDHDISHFLYFWRFCNFYSYSHTKSEPRHPPSPLKIDLWGGAVA